MGKRLTDPNKWDTPWFRKLNPEMKIILIYLWESCDMSGIWNVDFDKISFFTGIKTERVENLMKHIPKEEFPIYELEKEKWFFPSVVKFHNPDGLNSKKPQVKSIRKKLIINKLHLILNELYGNGYLMVSEPLTNGKQTIKEPYNEYEYDNEYEEKEGGVGEEKTSRAEILTEEEARERMMTSEIWIQQVSMTLTTDPETVINYIDKFFMLQKVKENLDRPIIELKRHFVEWLKIQLQKEKNNGNQSLTEQARKIVFGS